MLDGDTWTDSDPLRFAEPEQPWPKDQEIRDWFPPEPVDDFETWLFQPQAKGDLGDFGPMFNDGDEGASELDDVIVTGRRVEGFPTAVQVTIGDAYELPPIDVYGGGGGGGVTPDDDDCPWREFYRDAATQVGLFAGILGALKDSPFTLDPRDDRAIERALFAIDSLEIMLQSQTLDYSTLLTTVSSAIEIVLSEGTDHFAAVLGAIAGGGVAGIFDGPIPVGEVIGGIGGALAVYLAGDRLPTAQIAEQLARLLLANVEIPPDTPGRRCS